MATRARGRSTSRRDAACSPSTHPGRFARSASQGRARTSELLKRGNPVKRVRGSSRGSRDAVPGCRRPAQSLDRAHARGQVTAKASLDALVGQAFGLLWNRMFFAHRPLDEYAADDVTAVLAAKLGAEQEG
ncbi:TetR/AcrR family transcriptional regulator C-terminal ligand-binding domain-containing protein [Mycobacterium sp. Aquia_216]|uniref:TetR/AcrR family transcriptional regulator C-terminal ligand-binding domain-containing protein n=1 Tax=Mycobacterium sp. Aquia_216 TaxID=2991729 RepID=UPI003FA364E6